MPVRAQALIEQVTRVEPAERETLCHLDLLPRLDRHCLHGAATLGREGRPAASVHSTRCRAARECSAAAAGPAAPAVHRRRVGHHRRPNPAAARWPIRSATALDRVLRNRLSYCNLPCDSIERHRGGATVVDSTCDGKSGAFLLRAFLLRTIPVGMVLSHQRLACADGGDLHNARALVALLRRLRDAAHCAGYGVKVARIMALLGDSINSRPHHRRSSPPRHAFENRRDRGVDVAEQRVGVSSAPPQRQHLARALALQRAHAHAAKAEQRGRRGHQRAPRPALTRSSTPCTVLAS